MANLIDKFNESPNGKLVSDERISLDAAASKIYTLLHHNVIESKGIEVWTGKGKTGTKITDFTLAQDAAKPWVYKATFGASVSSGTYFITYYSSGDYADADDINNIHAQVKQNKRDIYTKFMESSPTIYCRPQLTEVTIMQGFFLDPVNNHLYINQLLGTSKQLFPAESYQITRCSLDGRMIDQMTVNKGGHGTNIDLENRNGVNYIWASYEIVDGTGTAIDQEIVCYQYQPGATIDETDASITRFPAIPKGDNCHPAICNKTRQMIIRRDNGPRQWITLHDLDDILAGKYIVLGEWDIPAAVDYNQGFALDEGYVYWRSGDATNAGVNNYPDQVTVFDAVTGEQVYQINVNANKDMSSRYEGDFNEPEGVKVYNDPKSGAKSLFVGIASGASGARISSIFAYHSLGNLQKHIPMIKYPMVSNEEYGDPTINQYQIHMIPLVIEYDTTNGWFGVTSARMPNLNSVFLKSITIGNTYANDLVLNLNELFYGLVGIMVTPDANFAKLNYHIGPVFYAGGGTSDELVLRIWNSSGTQMSPTDATMIDGMRISVVLMAYLKIE